LGSSPWRGGTPRLALLTFVLLAAGSAAALAPERRRGAAKEFAAEVRKRIDTQYADLEALYKHLHTTPELSLQEAHTAVRLAKELKALGFEVTEKVGGHGVVGVLKNGKGPTVL